eukprot:CAMPEP_0172642642 /NCGR_PEP_ID=MMETSP1068-20121228/233114_1 /TAXON_ID=35684 /ORGANISM="Pseudopedinella elastica, Strain CCMP716" /LENGTH=461 /DNA_ID=CAMNT_0013456509 /DNA_START=1638 /DNA_END=3023 /DNA_ORIENTATION=-
MLFQSLLTNPDDECGASSRTDISNLHEMTDQVKESCEIAIQTLNQLLLYEKIEGGVLELELTKEPAVTLVKNVCRQLSIQFQQKNIRLDSSFSGFPEDELEDPTVFINVDKAKLAQVVRNLLTNSFKFSSNNSRVYLRVSIETRNRGADSGEFPGYGQFVRVDVQDKGAGISCENLARLFKDIVQFNPASLQNGGGSGIGLYISKKLMELHGGYIEVTSEGEGFGSTFSIGVPIIGQTTSAKDTGTAGTCIRALPRVPLPMFAWSAEFRPELAFDEKTQGKKRTEQRDMSSQENSSKRTCSSEGESFTSKRMFLEEPHAKAPLCEVPPGELEVLLVDDSRALRKMVARFLKMSKLCASCTEADDGAEAVRLVASSLHEDSSRFDIILMDYVMPVQDGPTATAEIRQMGFDGKVIGLTGQMHSEDKELFVKMGADEVLTKPLDTSKLKIIFMEIAEKKGKRE